MPKQERKNVFKRSRRLGVRTYHFYRQMEKIFAAADIVVSMGGYNTLCEILSQGTLSLIIPRETPRKEQLIRAQTFQRQNLVDYIAWDEVTPDILRQKLLAILENSKPYQDAISRFHLTGIETMQQRLQQFRCKRL
jgi:predicted glycosyltransferase